MVLSGTALTLRRTVVQNNATADGPDRIPDGGGIYNNGTLVILDSTVRDNTAGGNEGSGGGIWNSGSLTLTQSNANIGLSGGGIHATNALTVTNSTVTGNFSRSSGGAVWLSTTDATLASDTVAGNVADSDQDGTGDGGGLAVGTGGHVFVRNTLLASNQDRGGQAPDCRTSGALESQGYNRFGSLVGCVVGGATTGNQVGGASMLGPLADNGE